AHIKPEDGMILVRNSSGIRKISEAFEAYLSANPDLDEDTQNYFKLVSDEAFRLSSSSAVCLIIDAFRALSNFNDPLAFAQLAYTFQSQTNSDFNTQLIPFFNSYRLSKELKKRPFQEFLPEEFGRTYHTLQKLPLYDLTEKIISIFNLFEQKNQHAFLYDFLDKVNAFVSQSGSRIEDFLDYWTDELQHKTIAVNAQVPGVRILTIHKSKGLEFHTVIVPFCEWDMDETRFEQLVWHESAGANVCDNIHVRAEHVPPLPLIPLNYGKSLKNSHFSKDFEDETLKLWVDNLNLLYVALTRPKHNLLVFADALPKKSEKLRVSNLLHTVLNPLVDGVFQEGEKVPSIEKQEDALDGNVFKMPLKTLEVPFSIATKQPTFYLSKEAIKFYTGAEYVPPQQSQLAKGLLYHRILAEIRYLEDVEKTIKRLVFDGFISEDEKIDVATHIRELLSHPQAHDWFSKKYRIFNECKIVNRSIHGHLEQRRPDRVMQDEHGHLILVDFKTGQKYPKHQEQIRDYAALLKDLFAHVENLEISGFLWYLDTNEIESV
ncbi:MAG: hypothetical protein LBU91_02245, partial [Bacteroidales bacterium]|nr:hypothetical protein [Bacteroidales bacterium]